VRVRGEGHLLFVGSGDPLPAGTEPRRFDSAVERRFARDFARAASAFELLREPEPVEADGTLVFPDFAIVERRADGRRWWLEIAGFWTPEYITRKLERLRAARLESLILCLDARRRCAPTDLPADAAVVRYDRWVDVAAVLRLIGMG